MNQACWSEELVWTLKIKWPLNIFLFTRVYVSTSLFLRIGWAPSPESAPSL